MDSPFSTSQSMFSSPMVMSPASSSMASQDLDYDSTALAMAILSGNEANVEDLVRLGATLSERHYWTLYQACLIGPDMIKALLVSPDITFNIRIPDDGGDSILHFVLRTPASRFGADKMQVVALLLEHGTDPFQVDHLGETALHILAGMPGEDETQLLRRMLASSCPLSALNHQNHYGDTALFVAVICNHYNAANLLLNLGADPNIKGEDGVGAAQYAFQVGSMEMLGLLQRFGAEIGEWMAIDNE